MTLCNAVGRITQPFLQYFIWKEDLFDRKYIWSFKKKFWDRSK